MFCDEAMGRPALRRLLSVLLPALLLAALSSACSPWRTSTAMPAPPGPVATITSGQVMAVPAAAAPTTPVPAAALPRPPRRSAPELAPALAPQRAARHWADFQLLAAQRLVDANPAGTYGGPVPEPLLAIPVLEIELNSDGSVRRITVKRQPRQALDTVQLAIAAVQRAAPFGSVSHLPRPWKFTEVFLFDEQRRFKPRTLDL